MTWRSRALRAARRVCRRCEVYGLGLGSYLGDRKPPRKGHMLPHSWTHPPWRRRAAHEYGRVRRALGPRGFVPGATLTFDGVVYVVGGDDEVWPLALDAREPAGSRRVRRRRSLRTTHDSARAIIAAELSRVTGAAVEPSDVVVDCESPGLVFVGVPGYGQIAGLGLRKALSNALSFLRRWAANGYTSPEALGAAPASE